MRFLPDARIFRGDLNFDSEVVRWKLKQLSFLIPTCTFQLKLTGQPTEEFNHPNGIVDMVYAANQGRRPVHDSVILIPSGSQEWDLKIAMQWTKLYSQEVSSYVNTIPTTLGGAHLEAFTNALLRCGKSAVNSAGLLSGGSPVQAWDV